MSALAINGIMFTLSCNLLMNSTSNGFNLQVKDNNSCTWFGLSIA